MLYEVITAHDLGIEAVIEVEVPLMPLHLPRSDRGEGRREEGDDQVMFAVDIAIIRKQAVLIAGQGKNGSTVTDPFEGRGIFRRLERRGGKQGQKKARHQEFHKPVHGLIPP